MTYQVEIYYPLSQKCAHHTPSILSCKWKTWSGLRADKTTGIPTLLGSEGHFSQTFSRNFTPLCCPLRKFHHEIFWLSFAFWQSTALKCTKSSCIVSPIYCIVSFMYIQGMLAYM